MTWAALALDHIAGKPGRYHRLPVQQLSEAGVLDWFRAWNGARATAAERLVREFEKILSSEARAVMGDPDHPEVQAFVKSRGNLITQAEGVCLQQVSDVEDPLRGLLLRYYEVMGTREKGVTRMSRLLPLCIAEFVPSIDEDVLIDFVRANAWGYEALRIQDDFLDEPDRVKSEWILLLGLFYRWTTEIYCKHSPDLSQFFGDYQKYHDAMSSAILQEGVESRSSTVPYNTAVVRAGERAGLIKLCASTLLTTAGRRADLPAIEHFLNIHLATRQLLDDLEDFRNDAEQGRTSVPLQMVRSAIAGAGEEAPSVGMLCAGLSFTTAPSQCLQIICDLCQEGLTCISGHSDTMLYKLLAMRLERAKKAMQVIQGLQSDLWAALG